MNKPADSGARLRHRERQKLYMQSAEARQRHRERQKLYVAKLRAKLRAVEELECVD